MPLWAVIYLFVIVLFGIVSIYIYRKEGLFFIICESFSLLFSVMMFLYYYGLYPKPDSITVIYGMFGFILYWEFIYNRKIYEKELKEINSKTEAYTALAVIVGGFMPLIYVTVNLLLGF